MRRMMAALAVAALGLATGGMGVMPVGAAPPDGPKAPSAAPAPDGPGSDELPNPLEEKRRELRATALDAVLAGEAVPEQRSAEHKSEPQSLMRISYAVFCLQKKTNHNQ